jgi:hypothetical protein
MDYKYKLLYPKIQFQVKIQIGQGQVVDCGTNADNNSEAL